ncbi:MAG TPA: oxygen-independent coproporphyrinogen III oxidase [Casimicrobiaceae bacterium]|nr:oxygen-independent coproporphyrinogen III oxidase [Casimicrobiaceae bacterium]
MTTLHAIPAQPAASVSFDPALIHKYDGFGPRYTSYPTADRFTQAFTAEQFVDAVLARIAGVPMRPLSLYVHLPFCDTICYYCACNKVTTRDHGRSAKYIRYLARELGIVSGLVDSASPVTQLHWGGGTPTFLSAEEMTLLWRVLRDNFAFAPDAECSIEVDPRHVNAETVELLSELGFNRMSLGVQDFDSTVQQAVNRIQSEAETRFVLDAARASGFRSLNIDLIYGLPRQTLAGFGVTLDKVLDGAPDRIALYSYAHVPHLFKPQRRISEAELPSADAKLAILELAIERLTDAGYLYIGMDHFALPDDELAVAQREGRLHRNFQGYSTHANCDLLAFGISAIGNVGATYSQNLRTLDDYYARLDDDALPCFRGWQLSADDILRRDVIHALMCQFTVSFKNIEDAHAIGFREYFATELNSLEPLADDGMVEIAPDAIHVTARGRLLVRTVAMAFDRYLRAQREPVRYSRII